MTKDLHGLDAEQAAAMFSAGTDVQSVLSQEMNGAEAVNRSRIGYPETAKAVALAVPRLAGGLALVASGLAVSVAFAGALFNPPLIIILMLTNSLDGMVDAITKPFIAGGEMIGKSVGAVAEHYSSEKQHNKDGYWLDDNNNKVYGTASQRNKLEKLQDKVDKLSSKYSYGDIQTKKATKRMKAFMDKAERIQKTSPVIVENRHGQKSKFKLKVRSGLAGLNQ
jgi:hypothetical protein